MGVGDRDGERTRDMVERESESCNMVMETERERMGRQRERGGEEKRKKKVEKQRKLTNKNTNQGRLCSNWPTPGNTYKKVQL